MTPTTMGVSEIFLEVESVGDKVGQSNGNGTTGGKPIGLTELNLVAERIHYASF